jgi:hypothetical protein
MITSILALIAGVLSAFYGRGQLREAKRVREETLKLSEKQKQEDDAWAEKHVKAGQLLCRLADMDKTNLVARNGRYVMRQSHSLEMMFGDDVFRHILGQLIQQQDDQTFALRPIDVTQLRLKANRDLIDSVLARFSNSQSIRFPD